MITIPTVQELSDQILSDLEGTLGQKVPILPKAFLRVLAKIQAGALSLLYRVLLKEYDQVFPSTAAEEALVRRGAEYGLTMRQVVAAILEVEISGDDGTVIPGATLWTGPNGLVYQQNSAASIADGTGTAYVTCTTGGADSVLAEASELQPVSPIAGVTGATVTAVSTEGEDAETVEQFRSRVLQRIANQPQGGSASDYVGWALEVPGIIKAFAFRTDPGEVAVYPLESASGADRVPAAGKIAEVQAYLSDPNRRPLCATITASAMTELAVDVTITTISPSNAAVKEAIRAALESYFYAAYPMQYPDEPAPTNKISVAAIWSAILGAGATAAAVTMSVSGVGAVTSYTLADDELVKLGDITWA